MGSLKDASDEQLREEIARRERERSAGPVPTPMEREDWRAVRQILVRGLQRLSSTGQPPKDFEEITWEAALMAVYGRRIFEWYNKALR